MTTKRTGPSRRAGRGAARPQRPQGGPARRSARRPHGGATKGALHEAVGGAVEGEGSRPGSRLAGEADDKSPEPGALRPLARALIELALALRAETEKGARG